MRFLISFLLLAVTPSVLAGGWVSGGGSLDYTEYNPWFIAESTSSVTYCVAVDESHFGISREEILPIIHEVIDYWRAEIRSLVARSGSSKQDVMTQEFNLVESCEEATDLAFQFGILSEEQQAFVKWPQKYAGFAIRTDYNEVDFRGKGFIYVSPESGPLGLQIEGMTERPWSNYNQDLLRMVLAHEFSHVLGFRHEETRVLNEDSIKYCLSSMGAPLCTSYGKQLTPYLAFTNPSPFNSTWATRRQQEFFGLEESEHYFKSRTVGDTLEILASKVSIDGPWRVAGRVLWRVEKPDLLEVWAPFEIRSGLNPNERRLSPEVAPDYRSGLYTPTNGGQIRSMMLFNDMRGNLTIGGDYNGRLIRNLAWELP